MRTKCTICHHSKKQLMTTRESNENTQNSTFITCRKCKKSFENELVLKNHLKTEHKTYRPCKNYSLIESQNRCSYKDKCDYNHSIPEPGTMICWDCGKSFTNKNYVMIHRRKEHNVSIVCKNVNTPAGCDRSDENCGYLHPKSGQQPPQLPLIMNLENTNHGEITKQQEFQKITQKKPIPLPVLDTQNKMEKIMMDMLTSIKEQNRTMVELILNMQRN